MKTQLLTLAALLAASFLNAQDLNPIQLSSPNLDRSVSMMDAFQKRSSSVEWSATKLSIQDLSDLLWAANGIN